jgi:hypothetical protein
MLIMTGGPAAIGSQSVWETTAQKQSGGTFLNRVAYVNAQIPRRTELSECRCV